MTSSSLHSRWLACFLCVVGLALFAWSRLAHPIQSLGNADIAGILYEADTINRGMLPYVATVDPKSPGSFWLIAALFRFVSRELWAIKAAYFLWALLAAPAIWLAARALYGRDDRGTIAAGGAVLLYLLSIGLFDFNYSAWMNPMYAWAFATLLLALAGRPRLHLLAGAFAGLTFLFKTHGLVIAPTFVMVWWWARRRGDPGAAWSAWPLWLAGALLSLVPLVLQYAWYGQLRALAGGLLPVSWALEYASQIQPKEHWIWSAWWRVPEQMHRVYPLQVELGLAALLAALHERSAARRTTAARAAGSGPVAPQLLFLAWSVVGCGLGGMRFYIHYLTQYLPALALLAAHPAPYRWLGRQLELVVRGQVWRASAMVLAVPMMIELGTHLQELVEGKAAHVDHRGTAGTRAIGELINKKTRPDECIQVWGWAAWSVYYWADRQACSPIFKVMGQVTDINQNSMFTRNRRMDFRPGPYADILLRSFKKRRPAYVVRMKPFFEGVTRDPLEQFRALHAILERDYVLRRKYRHVYLYERLDRLPPREQEAELRKREREAARKAAEKAAAEEALRIEREADDRMALPPPVPPPTPANPPALP